MFLFGAAQSDPPFLTRGIDALRAGVREYSARLRGHVLIARLHENHRPSLLQSIFVNEELVGRQARRGILLQSRPCRRSSHHSPNAENRGRCEPHRQHGSHPRNQDGRRRRAQLHAGRHPKRAAENPADCPSHARLLSLAGGYSFHLGRNGARNQQIDIPHTSFTQVNRRMFVAFARPKDSGNSWHRYSPPQSQINAANSVNSSTPLYRSCLRAHERHSNIF